MKKFKIKSVNLGVDGNNHDYLSSFRCVDDDGISINIDPLTSGEFKELDEMDQWEQIDWARKQIGKYLFARDLAACEYVTVGKTYIV